MYDFGKTFRNYRYYHKYRSEQIESVNKLLVYWGDKYGIPIKYLGDELFSDELDRRALAGEPGVYAHCSVRYDKSDINPQSQMVSMLKTL